jgi:hypothetical protein
MERGTSILLSTIAFLLICSFAMSVYAITPYGSLASGYAVTSNYHGVDVPPGASVVVTAMTTDYSVDKVTFIWKNPAGQVAFKETKPVYTNGTRYNGKLIRYANSTFAPNTIGDWGVQAKFLDVHNFCRWTWTERVARRATSFNVIPEVPVLGTAGASIIMLLGVAYKTKRNKKA